MEDHRDDWSVRRRFRFFERTAPNPYAIAFGDDEESTRVKLFACMRAVPPPPDLRDLPRAARLERVFETYAARDAWLRANHPEVLIRVIVAVHGEGLDAAAMEFYYDAYMLCPVVGEGYGTILENHGYAPRALAKWLGSDYHQAGAERFFSPGAVNCVTNVTSRVSARDAERSRGGYRQVVTIKGGELVVAPAAVLDAPARATLTRLKIEDAVALLPGFARGSPGFARLVAATLETYDAEFAAENAAAAEL